MGKERLFGGRDEDFYSKKWGTSCEKKAGGLSGAAARTGKESNKDNNKINKKRMREGCIKYIQKLRIYSGDKQFNSIGI